MYKEVFHLYFDCNQMKFSNFKQFGNCNNKFEFDDDGIERHEIGRCGFDDKIKW
jgi:hypothetical protein